MKILLDTNVILDHILSREPNAKNVEKIFDMICKDEIEAAFTANSVTDIYYIVSKRLGNATAREALRDAAKQFSLKQESRDFSRGRFKSPSSF